MLSNKISLVKKFVKLSKLRVVELLLVTTVPGMIVSLYSMPPLTLVLSTLAGGTLLAVSANVMNQVFEIERDKLMQRTSDRPLVTGELTRATGIVFSVLTGIIGFIVLYLLTTPTAAYIGLIANQFYIFIYTLILKPRTNQNIVIGGAAGAAPVLIGWTATGSTLDIGAWLLFLLVFMWTPAHFWALSIENKTDYEQADFPMLPTQETYERSTIYIAIYSCATVLISIAAAPVLQLGIIYLLIAVFLGTNLMFKSYNLYKKRIQPIKYFVFSNTYLAVIFLGIVADIMWTLRGVAV
ncbi:MAG: protoheme IX farnesyltransferase [Candidatus Actinomarina sp.]|jgi:protoheme IX farnesyltransferase|nr:protoheme IX farnesyltransferase [Actinomycetota bacterium]MBL6833318.1 protoheme IX farnesyltransferase [Candidatus Actinomarina sp.]MBL6837018.1 protoheme IX farnesyltransferase [Candidatus Actinomarina sp.]